VRLKEAEQQLEPKFAAALGPERYADYQEKTDAAWLFTTRLVNASGLPASTAPQLIAIQREFERRAEAVRQDSSLDAGQRAAHFSALGKEATARLLSPLGEKVLTDYRRGAVGNWLNRLESDGTPKR